jgi:hypothetical protein
MPRAWCVDGRPQDVVGRLIRSLKPDFAPDFAPSALIRALSRGC